MQSPLVHFYIHSLYERQSCTMMVGINLITLLSKFSCSTTLTCLHFPQSSLHITPSHIQGILIQITLNFNVLKELMSSYFPPTNLYLLVKLPKQTFMHSYSSVTHCMFAFRAPPSSVKHASNDNKCSL